MAERAFYWIPEKTSPQSGNRRERFSFSKFMVCFHTLQAHAASRVRIRTLQSLLMASVYTCRADFKREKAQIPCRNNNDNYF
ncbi:MAG: hypothetical protein EGP94_03065 [Lachnospiraceae bacterium]|nr:hypothetical protein [Lachnospiraceae bacterium]